MNLLPFRFLRRAIGGYSLTISIVFALGLLGVSAWATLYAWLRRVHVPWWAAVILPFLIVSAVAKREARWVPDPVVRRRWAIGIAVGAIVIAVLT